MAMMQQYFIQLYDYMSHHHLQSIYGITSPMPAHISHPPFAVEDDGDDEETDNEFETKLKVSLLFFKLVGISQYI